ncbi:unnamed protein product [Brassica napus]|uniref:(rape) hypothetical protein n=6 Tax=Brassica TaxID=3705 RepID=A0A816WRP7_BRANA|nr:unnamed protein product [Brassica napus]
MLLLYYVKMRNTKHIPKIDQITNLHKFMIVMGLTHNSKSLKYGSRPNKLRFKFKSIDLCECLLISGKVHGSLARAGKVRGQTPKVAKQDKKKKPRGRAHKRLQHNRRFVTAVVGFGKKRGPNSSEK